MNRLQLDWHVIQWKVATLEAAAPSDGPQGGETSKLWVDYDETFAILPPASLANKFPGTIQYYDYTMDWNDRGTTKPLDFNGMLEKTFSFCNGKGISAIGLPGTNLAKQAGMQSKASGRSFVNELTTIKNQLLHANVALVYIRTAQLWDDLAYYIKNLLKNGNKVTLEVLGAPLCWENDSPVFIPSRRKVFELSIPYNMLTHVYGSKVKYKFYPETSEKTRDMWVNILTNARTAYNNAAWSAANDVLKNVEEQLETEEIPQATVSEYQRLYVHKYGKAYGYDVRCYDLDPTGAAPSNQLSGKPGYAGTTFRSFWMDSEPYGGGLDTNTDARRLAKAFETSRRKDYRTHRADPDHVILAAYEAICWLQADQREYPELSEIKESVCTCGRPIFSNREYCHSCYSVNPIYAPATSNVFDIYKHTECICGNILYNHQDTHCEKCETPNYNYLD